MERFYGNRSTDMASTCRHVELRWIEDKSMLVNNS